MPDYIVKPYDVLFFRGNKSFHFGQWYTEGVFPPYPSTFQGFIRSKLLCDNDLIDSSGRLIEDKASEIKNLIGNDDNFPLNITGPYLINTKTGDIYFKTPADLFRKTAGCDICYSAFPSKDTRLESDLEFFLSCPDIPGDKPEKFSPPEYISLQELIQYRTVLTDIKVSPSKLYLTEDRVVIAINDKELANKNRVVYEGRFCVTPYNRLKNSTGFYCHIDRKIPSGSCKLGSESRLVYIQKLSSDNIVEEWLKKSRDELISEICKTKTFRLVLLQHGIFKNGWLPFEFSTEDNRLVAAVEGLKIELVFAFTGVPLKISGYSFIKSKSNTQKDITLKPMVNAVSAGSVYMFRIINGCTEENIKAFVEKYDNNKIDHPLYSNMGYNHLILGVGAKL
ncbi:MAG: hypothetical protein DDT22_00608 [candidate division WS2 bacterium]|nr:hypothetical protein [Candidatus Lithacetigena glycinireducens]